MARRRTFGALRRLPSKRHQASYLGPDGERHKAPSTFLRKGDAEGWLNDEELLIDRGEWRPPADRAAELVTADIPHLADYAQECIRRREARSRKPLKPSTADGYRQIIRLTFDPIAKLRVHQVTPTAVQRWYDGLDPDTPTQRANAYAFLRSVMTDAVHEGYISESPCKVRGAGKPEPAREGHALAIPQLLAYLDGVATVTREADRPAAAERRMMLMLAAWCSLRSGEVRALRRRDVADDGSVVRVERAVTRIGGRGEAKRWHFDTPKTAAGRRTVAVPHVVAQILAAFLVSWDARPTAGPDRLLFPAANGHDPLNDGQLRKAHNRGARAIGIPDLTIHDLRRTGATLAGQSGATIRELMRRLGHTRPDVAMIYQVADDERDRALAARMGAQLALPPVEPDPDEWRPWGLRLAPRRRSIFLED